jgi:hypothetical protein
MIYQVLAKVFLICSNALQFGVGDRTMDREQATAIAKHLRDANDAIDRATGVAFDLSVEDRKIFSALLRGFYRDCDEILERIYAGYPDLRPPPSPQEEPEISSPLRWADVTLPASVTEADLDRIIFSKLSTRLMKTARIVGDAFVDCKRLALPITSDIIGARIEELADEDRIESAGDLRYWRHSEIRLKPEDPN